MSYFLNLSDNHIAAQRMSISAPLYAVGFRKSTIKGHAEEPEYQPRHQQDIQEHRDLHILFWPNQSIDKRGNQQRKGCTYPAFECFRQHVHVPKVGNVCL